MYRRYAPYPSMMTFDAPAPGTLLARLAEDGDVVAVGIADVTPLALEENLIQVHDAERLVEPFAAERGAGATAADPERWRLYAGPIRLAAGEEHDLQGVVVGVLIVVIVVERISMALRRRLL
jgi:hypothetical protein